VRHVSGSSGLLHVEGSMTRISQFGLNIDGDATTVGARGTIAKVASETS
jgi:hypothetical protein